jgi:hypothetical protein
MEEEKDLDFYVSTPDEHFNHNAQHFYFQFTGYKKPKTKKSFEEMIEAIYIAYFFAKQNPSKPFKCIELVKTIANEKGFNDADLIVFMNLLLGVVSNMPDVDDYAKIYIQLVDFRHELLPFDKDPDFDMNNNPFRFDVEEIKDKVRQTTDPHQRMKFLTELYFDFKGSECLMGDFEKDYYFSEGLLQFLNVELERVEFELKINRVSNKETISKKSLNFKIASKRKTDVVKILSAMYDSKLFANAEGQPATNKQELMEAFGEFIGENLSAYSTMLSQAKNNNPDFYLKTFDDLKRAGREYFEKE